MPLLPVVRYCLGVFIPCVRRDTEQAQQSQLFVSRLLFWAWAALSQQRAPLRLLLEPELCRAASSEGLAGLQLISGSRIWRIPRMSVASQQCAHGENQVLIWECHSWGLGFLAFPRLRSLHEEDVYWSFACFYLLIQAYSLSFCLSWFFGLNLLESSDTSCWLCGAMKYK